MEKAPKKLVIWDMDGTVIDSRSLITECMTQAFNALNLIPPNRREIWTIVGLSLSMGVRQLAPRESRQVQDQIENNYREAFFARRTSPGFEEPVYEGIWDVIRMLSTQNYLQAIATGKSRRGLDALIEHHKFDQHMGFSVCADDGPSKPHPFMLESCLDHFALDPQDAIMVGDTSHDIEMANAIKMQSVGVTWGFHEKSDLEKAQATFIVDHVDQLHQILVG